jgi:hypothetical protein
MYAKASGTEKNEKVDKKIAEIKIKRNTNMVYFLGAIL